MKFLRIPLILLAAIFLSAVGPVLAQTDETTPVTFRDGVTVYYPAGWEVVTDSDNTMQLQNDATGLYVFLYSLYDLDNDSIQPGDTLAILEFYHNANMTDQSDAFDAAQTQTVTVNEREITYFEPMIVDEGGSPYQTLRGSMVLDETGRMVAFGAYPLKGAELATAAEEIFGIIASAETGLYYLQDGTSFVYPATWDSYVDDNSYIRLDSGATNIRLDFLSPDTLKELGATEDNLVPALEDAFGSANDTSLTFDAANATPITAGDYAGMQYQFTDTYEGEAYERLFVITFSPDGWVNMFDIVPNTGAQIDPDDKAAVLDILASFEVPTE